MVRTRFAPSPTGYLHIGGLRTALYAYLFAKKQNGSFILRIEDTDLERYVKDAVPRIISTLRETGVEFDEGPEIGGAFGPYVQSERKEIYKKYALELIDRGGAYYCFCTKERLAELSSGGAVKYDKHCLHLSKEEAARRAESGEPYVIRQNIPESGVSSYTDMVFGEISVNCKDLEDNILLKSDGMPTYNFANVVDDHLMEITHVIRGTEYLSSTPKYNLIYRSFGWETPEYMHLQPIMKNATEKLSKRHGDASYEDFINKGYLKDAIVNYIALLGWSPKDDREKLSMDELKSLFSVEGITRAPSIFDENKMRWLNSCYVSELSDAEFHERAVKWYGGLSGIEGLDLPYLSSLLKTRTEIFSQIPGLTAFLTAFKGFDLTLLEHQKSKSDLNLAREVLPEVLKIAESADFAAGELHDKLLAFAAGKGYKNSQVLWPFRIAITGCAVTPGGAIEMARLLGKRETLRRLTETVARL